MWARNDGIPVKFDELVYNRKRIISEEQVFLRVLVEGETGLYYYNEKKSGRHFYVHKGAGSEIIELKRYSAIIEIEGEKELVVKDEYKDQLGNIMRDCMMILPLVHLSDYNREDLAELIEEYNKCTEQEVHCIAELPSVKYDISLSAGLSAFYINFYGSGSADLAAAEFPVSIKPNAAVGLNIIFPFARKTFSVYNELGLHYYKTGDIIQWYENENEYEDVEMNLGAAGIRLLTAYRYTYPAPQFRPYIYAGIVNVYSFSTINNKTSVTHFYTTDTEHTGKALPEYRRYSQSVAAGLGIQYKNAGLDLRYERGNDITSTINLNSCTNIVFVQVQFIF